MIDWTSRRRELRSIQVCALISAALVLVVLAIIGGPWCFLLGGVLCLLVFLVLIATDALDEDERRPPNWWDQEGGEPPTPHA